MSTFRINYNSSAATALNNVNSTSEQSNKLQRQLSTGLRINEAADDPIGMIKSEIFRTQISGVSQARANAQEGINYIKTADAQLSEVNTLLQNARTYAIQAANSGVLDEDQINALDLQLKKNISSINSIASSAAYGNKKILDGTAGISTTSIDGNTDFVSFTGNFNGNATTSASTDAAAVLVGSAHGGYTSLSSNVTSGVVTINGVAATFTAGSNTVQDIVNFINGISGLKGSLNTTDTTISVTTTAVGTGASFAIQDTSGVIKTIASSTTYRGTRGVIGLSLTTKATAAVLNGSVTSYTADTTAVAAPGTLTLNGVTIGTYIATDTVGKVVSDINNAKLGITAVRDTGTNKVILTSAKMGSDQSINLIDTGGIINGANSNTNVKGVDAVANVTLGATTIAFNKGKGMVLQDADGNQISLTTAGNNLTLNTPTNIGQMNVGNSSFCIDPNNSQAINIVLQDTSSKNLGRKAVAGKSLADASLKTADDARDALLIIDQAIKDISNRRANLGSIQKNTLESALRSLSVTKENLQASESDIRNLDFADAITQATMLQIRTQSGMAQLAQANTAPQAVLNLLRGN